MDLELYISVNWTTIESKYTILDTIYAEDKRLIKDVDRADLYTLDDLKYDPEGNIIHKNGVPLYSAYSSKFGNYDPDWIWGLNTTVRYKNWNFFVSVDGRVGGLAQTTTEMYMWRSGSHPNSVTPERYLDATVPGSKNYTGEGVKVVSGSATYDTYGNITSDDRVYAPNDVAVTYESYVNTIHAGTAWGGSPSPLEAYSTTFSKSGRCRLPMICLKIFARSLNRGVFRYQQLARTCFCGQSSLSIPTPMAATKISATHRSATLVLT